MWTVDANDYTDEAIELILDVGRSLGAVLPGGRSHTLVTKTMLGVFGCVPAFDAYFKCGLGVATFGPKSLRAVGAFYETHRDVVESHRVNTWDFDSDQLSRSSGTPRTASCSDS